MDNIIQMKNIDGVDKQEKLIFERLKEVYKELGQVDDLTFHSPAREFEYGFAIRHSGIKNTDRVLDAGCGSSPLLLYLKRFGYEDLTGIDTQSSFDNPTFSFKPEWREQLGINYVQANIINYRSKVFDVIFCISVLEHIFRPIDRLKAIINLWENLKDGGKLIMTFDYMQWVGIGLQYLLLNSGKCIECINYKNKITAICLKKTNNEGMSEWVQMNQGL